MTRCCLDHNSDDRWWNRKGIVGCHVFVLRVNDQEKVSPPLRSRRQLGTSLSQHVAEVSENWLQTKTLENLDNTDLTKHASYFTPSRSSDKQLHPISSTECTVDR